MQSCWLRRAVAMIHPECGPMMPDSIAQNASNIRDTRQRSIRKGAGAALSGFEAYDSAKQNATAWNHQGRSPAVTWGADRSSRQGWMRVPMQGCAVTYCSFGDGFRTVIGGNIRDLKADFSPFGLPGGGSPARVSPAVSNLVAPLCLLPRARSQATSWLRSWT